jgi:hypothetical protein
MDAPTGNALNEVCLELGLVWRYEPAYKLVRVETNPKLNPGSSAALLHATSAKEASSSIHSFSVRELRSYTMLGTLRKRFWNTFFSAQYFDK